MPPTSPRICRPISIPCCAKNSREAENAGRVPNWLSTHPSPQNRVQRVNTKLGEYPEGRGASVRRDAYLRQIDGIVFGPDPREGFFRGSTFYHPDMAFQIEFPRGFQGQNQKQVVGAISPNQDAVVVVTLTGRGSPASASREFFAQQGIEMGRAMRGDIGGMEAVTHEFAAVSGQTPVRGLASFVEHGGRVFQLLGYTTTQGWSRYDDMLVSSIESFERLRERRYLDAQPMRLKIVPSSRLTDIDDIARRSPVGRDTLVLINGGDRADAAFVKTVVGDDLAVEILREQQQRNRDRQR